MTVHTDVPAKNDSTIMEWCRGGAESVWLMVLMGTAMLIQPRAVHAGFQQYKCGLLKLLGLVGMLVLIVHTVAQVKGRWQWRSVLSRDPLRLSLMSVALCVVVSTGLSVDWRMSLWGSYEMAQGAITWFAGFVLLMLIATFLRTWQQAWRLVDLLLVVSATVAIHAVLQRLGYDPQEVKDPQELDASTRAYGLAGNPIYLAGYLLMIVPLTLGRLRCLREKAWCLGGCHRMMLWICLGAQMAAIACTSSRGPLLGLGVGLCLWGVLAASICKWRRGQQAMVVLIGAVVVVAMIGLVYASLSQAGRASGVVSVPLLGNDSGRSAFWARAPELIVGIQRLQHPTGGADAFHALRPWFGHGLETLPLVLPEHFAGAPGFVIENRFHNAAWDHTFALGIVGLIGMFAVLASAFGLGYRAMGLLPNHSAMVVFGLAVSVCPIGSAIALGCVLGMGFVGLGLVLGLSIGLIAVAAALACRYSTHSGPGNENSAWLMATVLASLVGHVADMAFVFESAPTFSLLFVLLGLMLALSRGLTNEAAAVVMVQGAMPRKKYREMSAKAMPLPDWRGTVARAALLSGGLVLLIYSLNHEQSFEPLNTVDVLAFSFCNPGGIEGHSSLMFLPVLVFWLAGSCTLARKSADSIGELDARSFQRVLLMSGAIGVGYALINSAQVVSIGPIPRRATPVELVVAQAHSSGLMLLTFIGVLLSLTLLAGWGLARRGTTHAFDDRARWLVIGSSAVVLLAASWPVAVAPLLVDSSAQWGVVLESFGRTRLAAEMYARAIADRPELFGYRVLLTENLLQQAEAAPESTEAKAAWQLAERVMLAARDDSDLNRSGLYLGRIYNGWALAETGESRAALAQKASTALTQARIFDPLFEPVVREQSLLQRLVLDDVATGQTLATEASRLGEDGSLAWAEHYAARAARSGDAGLANELSAVSLGYFDLAIKDAEHYDLLARAQEGKGKVLLTSGHVASAIPWFIAALKGIAERDRWPVHVLLAQAYAQQSDFLHAREQVELAIPLAPIERRAELRQLLQMLEGR